MLHTKICIKRRLKLKTISQKLTDIFCEFLTAKLTRFCKEWLRAACKKYDAMCISLFAF